MEKYCNHCGEHKDLDQFWNSRATKDGKQYKCIPCMSQVVKEFIQINPEYPKKRYKNNVKTYKSRSKLFRLDHKSDYNVYLLPDHNYVGVTNNMYYRMCNHKFV